MKEPAESCSFSFSAEYTLEQADGCCGLCHQSSSDIVRGRFVTIKAVPPIVDHIKLKDEQNENRKSSLCPALILLNAHEKTIKPRALDLRLRPK